MLAKNWVRNCRNLEVKKSLLGKKQPFGGQESCRIVLLSRTAGLQQCSFP